MPEPYQVESAPRARRDMRALAEGVAAACFEFIARPLAAEPHRVGQPLMRPWDDGHWSARRGTYRVIFRLDDDARLLQVVHIDHRSRAYRRR